MSKHCTYIHNSLLKRFNLAMYTYEILLKFLKSSVLFVKVIGFPNSSNGSIKIVEFSPALILIKVVWAIEYLEFNGAGTILT